MKLHEHVALLKSAIENAYDKEFARLGFGKIKILPIDQIPEEIQTRRQRFESMLDSHIGETGDYGHAREKLVDELTFTLFNRLAAVKVMEAANLFPPIITRKAEHGGRSFGHKAWLEANPHQRDEDLEGLKTFIKSAFNELSTSLPLFSSKYSFSLFPDTISLNEIIDLFNAVELDSQVGSDIWENDDVLGWCYESYNNKKKQVHKESKAKTEYDKVSLQSQVYTPRWIVQFLVENSLGKLYLEMHPDSNVKYRYKIANVPQTQEREIKSLHEVKVIDPACGSGNFLLYAFDLFYELYIDQIENYAADYEEKDIPRLIIENNLHGIDLDDRAVQLAQLGLFIKAKKRLRTIGELNFNVVSSDFFLPDYPDVAHIFESNTRLGKQQQDLIAEIWTDLQYAYKFGSLIRLREKVERRLIGLYGHDGSKEPQLFSNQDLGIIPQPQQADAFIEQDIASEKEFIAEFFLNLEVAVDQYATGATNAFLASKTRDAITFLELLTKEYDVATANPPYTDSSDFGPELKEYIENNYKKPHKFHSNLYAAFILRCFDLTSENGLIAMLQPFTFMYIKKFEDVRKYILTKSNINLLAELGLGGVFISDVQVYTCMNILSKGVKITQGTYFNLMAYHNHRDKPQIFSDIYNRFIQGTADNHVYTIPQVKLKIIKSWPFIYWISGEFLEKFKQQSIDEVLSVRSGITTSNNIRCVRFRWEVLPGNISIAIGDKKPWVGYAKGGPFQKWLGNDWLVIDYSPDGYDFLLNNGNHLPSRDFYFKEGITYSASGSKGASFRYLPANHLFDTGGSCIFPNSYNNIHYSLAFLNSKLSFYIAYCFNPTVNTQGGDLKRVPFVIPKQRIEDEVTNLAKRCIEIQRKINSYDLLEPNFIKSPIETGAQTNLKRKLQSFFTYENYLLTQILISEAIIDNKIFEVYDLSDEDKNTVLAQEGKNIGGLPVQAKARDAYLAETEAIKEFPLDAIGDFIESLPIKEFTGDELEAIVSGFNTLYQGNNNLEEFCIRHQINPINVWYWFKQNNVIPLRRVNIVALEFLTVIIREILMEDEDGIIPLVPNAGEKVMLDRIEEKFSKKGFSFAQDSSFDTILGYPIQNFLKGHFFAELSDRVKVFKKLLATPFIWHLSSGSDQGFDCYIIIYKWNRDNLMRLRSVYIEHRERALINRQADLAESESASAQTEKDLIFRQLHEIESFKSKIDELLAEGYDPILDDGVGKNIAPLQKKGMIPYDVLNPAQLEKYLNTDW